MLEKLLQAIAITLLLTLFAGIGAPQPKAVQNPLLQAFSMLHLELLN